MGKQKRTVKFPKAKYTNANNSSEKAVVEFSINGGSAGKQASVGQLQCTPLGLNNLGNTCFFNSMLQSVACAQAHVTSLAPFARHSKKPISTSFFSFLQSLKHNAPVAVAATESVTSVKATMKSFRAATTVSPSALLAAIGAEYSQFKGRQQQDAHEVYLAMLTSLGEDFERLQKRIEGLAEPEPLPNSFARLFQGSVASVVCCHICKTRSIVKEMFYDLSLSIPGSERLHAMSTVSAKLLPSIKLGGSSYVNSKKQSRAAAKAASEAKKTKAEPEISPLLESTDGQSAGEDESKANSADMNVDTGVNVVDHAAIENLPESGEADTNTEESSALCPDSQPQYIDDASESPKEEFASSVLTFDVIEPPLRPHQQQLERQLEQLKPSPSAAAEFVAVNVYTCLDEFTKLEGLSTVEDNGYECLTCKRKTNADKRLLPFELPPVLVLHLKRLLPGGKFDKFVRFPLELNMQDYVARVRDENDEGVSALAGQLGDLNVSLSAGQNQDPLSQPTLVETAVVESAAADDSVANDKFNISDETSACSAVVDGASAAADNASPPLSEAITDPKFIKFMYSLAAVIVHQGSARGGHYIAYVKYEGHWFYCSDSHVERCTENDVLGCQAYMLYYIRQ